MATDFEIATHDAKVSALIDMRSGDVFDLVVSECQKPFRFTLDAVTEDSLIVHVEDSDPIRIFKACIKSVSLPQGRDQ